jgi:hypothetical protein
VGHRSRDRLPSAERGVVYGTCAGLPATRGDHVDTEASNVGIGDVLSQVQDGSERVVAYFSKTVEDREELL